MVNVDCSRRTVMQVMYPAHVIAAAAFYFARKFTQTEVSKCADGKEWWEDYGVKIENLRGTALSLTGLMLDSLMMMVELYEMLPQLQYQGKYPNSMVSPNETGKDTPQHNETTLQEDISQENGSKTENLESKTEENGTSNQENRDISPAKSPPAADSPNRRRSSITSLRDDRGRSPRRKIDSYVPSRDSRSSDRRPSDSRGRGSSYSRYVSPEKRRRSGDYYHPHGDYSSKRRRSIHDGEPDSSPEKRRKSDEGEMSEGEIR